MSRVNPWRLCQLLKEVCVGHKAAHFSLLAPRPTSIRGAVEKFCSREVSREHNSTQIPKSQLCNGHYWQLYRRHYSATNGLGSENESELPSVSDKNRGATSLVEKKHHADDSEIVQFEKGVFSAFDGVLAEEQTYQPSNEGSIANEQYSLTASSEKTTPVEGSRTIKKFQLQQMLKSKPPKPQTFSHLRSTYQMMVIDVNRTCKVTKSKGILSFTAFVICGNGNGAVGFGKGKSAEMSSAVDKAYARSVRNLHYFERFERRTTFGPLQAKYGKSKVYIWPGYPGSGMKAGGIVGGILRLAGYKDVKTKVIGSRHPHNTVKATFKALGLDEMPPEMAARQAPV